LEFAQALLEADLSTATADQCVESVVVNDIGEPLGGAVALIGDTHIDLLVEAPAQWFEAMAGTSAQYDVTLDEHGATAIQIEGPRSWTVVADLDNYDIRQLGVGECVPAEVDGIPVVLARTGTTGEHGYLIFMPDEAGLATLVAMAEKVGGGLIDTVVLPRVWIESGAPGAAWRRGGSVGWGQMSASGPAPQSPAPVTRRCVPVLFKDADCPPVGALASVDGNVIGQVVVQAPLAGQADGLGMAMLDDRYTHPGIDIQVGSVEGRVVAQPLINLLSDIEEIGAASVVDPPTSCCADPSVGWRLV
jgi:hypothetical protein